MLIIEDFRRISGLLRSIAPAHDMASHVIDLIARPAIASEEIAAAAERVGLSAEHIIADLRHHRTYFFIASDLIVVQRLAPRRSLERIMEAVSVDDDAGSSVRRILGTGLGAVLCATAAAAVPAVGPTALAVALFLAAVLAAGLFFAIAAVSDWHVPPEFADRVRREFVYPRMRKMINDRLRTEGMEELFHVTTAPGLVDVTDRKQLVSTASTRRLERAAHTMAFGSIGVAGPRGVGKSTLLRAFCDHALADRSVPDLRILMSAPVQYAPRDFVLHAFARLCEEIARIAEPPPKRRGPVLVRALGAGCAVAGAAVAIGAGAAARIPGPVLIAAEYLALYSVAGLVLGAAAWALARPSEQVGFQLLSRTAPVRSREDTRQRNLWLFRLACAAFPVAGIAALAAGAAGLVENPPLQRPPYALVMNPTVLGGSLAAAGIALAFAAGPITEALRRRRDRPENIGDTARRHLRRLAYIETVTTGVTGALSAPRALQLGGSRSRALAEQERSLPQLVGEYREFAAAAVEWWRARHGGQGRLIIGIDEVDKIGAERSEKFVSEVKSLFGVAHCLYVVSVSDEALRSFEQRTATARDVFDTAFDDILRIDHLSFTEVRALLLHRIAGIPEPLVALCYALSGGLPRDCLRTARSLVDLRAEHQRSASSGLAPSSADYARHLVDTEVSQLLLELYHRTHRTSGVESGGTSADAPDWDLMDRIDPRQTRPTPLALRAAADAVSSQQGMAGLQAQLAFLAAVTEAFIDGRERLSGLLRDDPDTAVGLLDRLARARALSARNPEVALRSMQRFTEAWQKYA